MRSALRHPVQQVLVRLARQPLVQWIPVPPVPRLLVLQLLVPPVLRFPVRQLLVSLVPQLPDWWLPARPVLLLPVR